MKQAFYHMNPGTVIKGLLLTVLAASSMCAQDATTNQVVMLQVKELNKIDLIGGPLTLVIGGSGGNSVQSGTATDVSTKLLWTSNASNRKIAVASNIASPRFVLRIQAEQLSPGAGVAEPEVTLTNGEPHDLILGVQRAAGSCTLKFTAAAGPEEGVGTESHLITYTITGC